MVRASSDFHLGTCKQVCTFWPPQSPGLHTGFFFYGGLTLPYNRIRACVIGVGYREPHPELSFCFSTWILV